MNAVKGLLSPKITKITEEIVAISKAFENEILVAICVVAAFYLILALARKARSNFPPGPIGLPIIGYFPFITENVHLDFIALGKKYGDVFSVRLGSETLVVLHGVEAIKEAYTKPEFLGRPPDGPLKLYNETSAFFVGDVHCWREQRRYVVQSMKDLGLGKTKIETEIQDEISHFLEVLSSHNGQPMDLCAPLSPSMSNNICALVFGKRYQYEDPDRIFLDKVLEEGTGGFSQTSAFAFFPWMRSIPFFLKFMKIEKALSAFDSIRNFFRQEIKKHRDTFDTRKLRDFIDTYLVEMESRKKKDPNTSFTDEILISNVIDLFVAGSETVRTSILWCIYVAAAYPDVQKKVRNEILDVMGPDRNPDFQDMKNMPFTHAFILEVMRWKTIVPLNVVHYTVDDTTVGGYNIPKNTMVLANLWNAHHDPKYWSDPDSFKPERFLSKDGRSVVKPSKYMPFSLGKRTCPGEVMAYMEMFLYFTSMLQKFEIKFPAGEKPTYKAKFVGTYKVEPYNIRFILRS